MGCERQAPRFILILSSERSGSTLTRVILGANSRVVAPLEMFLMRYPDFRTFMEQKAVAMEAMVEFFGMIGQPKTADEIAAHCRDLTTPDVYRWLMSFLRPEQILLDKTPAYANDGDTLRRSLPLEPFYIWLVRHPLAVIESHVRLQHKRRHVQTPRGWAAWARDSLVEGFEGMAKGLSPVARQREVKWVMQNTTIREFVANLPPEQYCKIRFEDLVADPATQVQRLCDAIGIAMEPAMLEATGARKKMNVFLGDPNFHKHDKIDPAMAVGWRKFFSEDQLTYETRRLMDMVGVARG